LAIGFNSRFSWLEGELKPRLREGVDSWALDLAAELAADAERTAAAERTADAELTGAGALAGAVAATVRLGRASLAVRTRLGPDVKRLVAFLPPLVSALRRSSAASRLEVLAMSARRME
jgi:hypothetical protein